MEQARRARAAVSVVFAVCGAAFATWAARIPAAQAHAGLSAGRLAVGLFGLAAGSVAALVAAGPVLTKIGSRRGVLAGATVLCAGLPLAAFAPDLVTFVGALVVLGVGNSLLDVSMNAHALRVEEEYGRPIFAGFHAFWNIGGLLGSGAGALMETWRVPLQVHFTATGAVLLLVALGAATRFLPGADRGQGDAAFALPSKALIPLGVIAFCGFVAEGTVNDWSAVYLREVTSATAALASLGYFGFSITMIAVRVVADRLVERHGVVPFMRTAAAVTMLGFLLVVAVPLPWFAVAGFAVVGLGVSGMVPLAWSAASRKQADAPSRAIAAVAACGYFGFLVGPVLIGALAGGIGLHWTLAVVGTIVVSVYFLAPTMRVAQASSSR
ncbi:MFS transporter [Amycolatopsis sp. FDAARGOS 1241]|uniref:MFS transporter n=1 Tax=Amycolatopsis sp. FDAARGOS 1241 TaxID=2778070 RepID=UPI001951F8C5|nr:MFS transporter [Amycolatopsis sp. FDAARGOS 1241]QRP46577.1 MFS transporter [Amycolatopsis sp. FDAARGOS 1241]